MNQEQVISDNKYLNLWKDLLRMEYSKGRYDTITKAVEWLYQRQTVDLEVNDIEKFIDDFKKAMEEQK